VNISPSTSFTGSVSFLTFSYIIVILHKIRNGILYKFTEILSVYYVYLAQERPVETTGP